MFKKYVALASTAMLLSASAGAQVGLGVTADVGTTGVGAHLVVPMETNLNGRFGINYVKHDFDSTAHAVHYDVKGKLQTIDLLFDWYLREGSDMRVTAGVLYNANRLSADARPDASGNIALNGHAWPASIIGKVIGNVDYRKAAPYIGIGWGNALKPAKGGKTGWNYGFDAGVYYQGNANVHLASADCRSIALVCSLVASDVAAEAERLKKHLDDFKVYPVLRASVGYSF
ncbi:hypothetical protein [Massilia sp. TN1-12]|uniref:hypothetical protein n=1 Tax=Massilia paldalensis TaxID=3377675 RepID=UPI00384FD6B5